ncbi:MAG: response regulator transcription factor [Bacteroidetes bacterium]|nr:response regulator transcription factor [Bacteroidota bacterium]
MENENVLNVVIVEDEPKNVTLLKKMLNMYCPQVNVSGDANSVEGAVKKIQACKPDLVLLDIEVSGGNAFHILDLLQPICFDVVFITAYDNYMLQAIKYSALDYLFKPVNIQELIAAIHKSSNKLIKQKTFKQVQVLLQNISKPKALSSLALPNATGLQFITIQNIVKCEAMGSYTNIFTSDGKSVIASRTLKEFEEILPHENFFRTHHSFIINLNFIARYHKGNGGYIEMIDNSQVPLAARRKNDFIKLFTTA